MKPGTSASSYESTNKENKNKLTESMYEETIKHSDKLFKCSCCSLQEHYDFKGTKPPFAKHITYLEECYVLKDPFGLPNKGEVLVIGGECNVCKAIVCLRCSIFYGKRFCQTCVEKHLNEFPPQVQLKIKT